MTEPHWLEISIVRVIHIRSIARFGGAAEVRDTGLLESAVNKPRNLHAYGSDPSIFDLAAAYCAGIVHNHPFVDGNKRAGLLAAHVFLDMNGQIFRPVEADAVKVIVALAAGEIDEDGLAVWFAENTTPREG
ncbi:MAG: type II toxin-antitoxin system death-on-curing family toxin [Proteobacteria bacterium]|nr:type II toxin-antitoxin system death-on-curing family toxin [Pseudomonadota bacterium]